LVAVQGEPGSQVWKAGTRKRQRQLIVAVGVVLELQPYGHHLVQMGDAVWNPEQVHILVERRHTAPRSVCAPQRKLDVAFFDEPQGRHVHLQGIALNARVLGLFLANDGDSEVLAEVFKFGDLIAAIHERKLQAPEHRVRQQAHLLGQEVSPIIQAESITLNHQAMRGAAEDV